MDPKEKQQAVATDALEKPNEAVDPNAALETTTAGSPAAPAAGGKPPKQPSAIKKLFKKVNLYFLIFIFIVVIAGAIAVVSFLNNKKVPKTPTIATQKLDQDTLNQLANTDVTVGGSGQTLTVQGNAIFAGQILAKSSLSVAGSIQANSIKIATETNTAQLTVSGKSNLNDVQANTLQVANGATIQGSLTLQKDLNVGGTTSLSGPVTASQITVTNLILSGNATLQVPNHISFTGASPTRSINPAPLGAGGTASVNGSDTAGTVSISTGNGTVAGCFITLTFNQKFTSTPRVIIGPVGAGAGLTQFYADPTLTGFSICTDNPAPTGQTFGYNYFVTQ